MRDLPEIVEHLDNDIEAIKNFMYYLDLDPMESRFQEGKALVSATAEGDDDLDWNKREVSIFFRLGTNEFQVEIPSLADHKYHGYYSSKFQTFHFYYRPKKRRLTITGGQTKTGRSYTITLRKLPAVS